MCKSIVLKKNCFTQIPHADRHAIENELGMFLIRYEKGRPFCQPSRRRLKLDNKFDEK